MPKENIARELNQIHTPSCDKLEKLLQDNQYYLKAIYESTEKTRKYILWGKIMTLIYLILIIAPIIFAIVYLPPMLEGIIAPYQELLGSSSGSAGNLQDYLDTLKALKIN